MRLKNVIDLFCDEYIRYLYVEKCRHFRSSKKKHNLFSTSFSIYRMKELFNRIYFESFHLTHFESIRFTEIQFTLQFYSVLKV